MNDQQPDHQRTACQQEVSVPNTPEAVAALAAYLASKGVKAEDYQPQTPV